MGTPTLREGDGEVRFLMTIKKSPEVVWIWQILTPLYWKLKKNVVTKSWFVAKTSQDPKPTQLIFFHDFSMGFSPWFLGGTCSPGTSSGATLDCGRGQFPGADSSLQKGAPKMSFFCGKRRMNHFDGFFRAKPNFQRHSGHTWCEDDDATENWSWVSCGTWISVELENLEVQSCAITECLSWLTWWHNGSIWQHFCFNLAFFHPRSTGTMADVPFTLVTWPAGRMLWFKYPRLW